MAVLTGQARVDAQAKVTAMAEGLVKQSGDTVASANYVNSQAEAIAPLPGRLGGPSASDVSINTTALNSQLTKIDRQIAQNNEFVSTFNDATKSWVNDTAIVSARQQVSASTADLQAQRDTITATLSKLNGAPQSPADFPSTKDNAASQLTDTNASPPAAVTAGGDVTTQEAKNIANNTNPTPGGFGEDIRKAIQNTADSEVGVGKVEVGTPRFNSTSGPTPDKTNTAPLKNPLHYFANYTYGLSLHLLTKDQYNKMVKDQTTYKPENVLVASAGRYNPTNFIRNKRFDLDFYFDDFNLTTLIAPNMHSRNTNAIEGSFTLIEPSGFTFMERLILASQELGMKNYLQNPYMLQIDFFAINDQGVIEEGLDIEMLPPKRIPIKITKVDAKVSNKGSEYKIGIIPFRHSAYDVSTVSTPANFEITATTVGEFFQSIEGTAEDVSALFNVDNNGRETPSATNTPAGPQKSVGPNGTNPIVSRINAAATAAGNRGRGAPPLKVTIPPAASANPNSTPSAATKNTSKTYTKVSSYGSAINAWQYVLKERYKVDTKDVYRFDIDPEIAGSKFIDRLRNSPKDTPMAVDKAHQISMAKSNAFGSGANTYNSEKAIFQVNAGTTIEKLLDTIVGLSDYTLEQLAVPDKDPEYKSKVEKYAQEPFRFHKVVVSVELGDFDDKKKVWSRIITYHIVKYKMWNVSSSLAPQGVFEHPVKAYNYIYTGLNVDVIDFNIEFNALYFNAITAYRDSLADATTLGAAKAEEQYYQNFPDYKGDGGTLKLGVNTVMPTVVKPQVANPRAQATGGPVTAKEIAARDLIDSFMIANKADMLNVKLKILGDPDYIKQDDVFYGPETAAAGAGVSGDNRQLANGSLHMDTQEVYIQLVYKTPIDIKEEDGLMNFDKQYVMSVFSGLYKIIQIKNVFSQGQFTQELDLVRLPRQKKFDYVNAQDTTTNEERAAFPGKLGISQDNIKGPDFSVPQKNSGSSPAVDDTVITTGQEQGAGADNPTSPVTADQADLMNVDKTTSSQPITDQSAIQATQPPPPPPSPVAAQPGSVFDGISASDVQYIRSQSAALGLNPNALNGYLTNRLQDYPPTLRAKVAADVVKLKEILRKRNQ